MFIYTYVYINIYIYVKLFYANSPLLYFSLHTHHITLLHQTRHERLHAGF